jgi:multidrug transporter EmrE-like cation transporter
MSPLTIVAILGSLSLSAIAQVLLRKGMIATTTLPPGALHLLKSVSCNLWVWAGLTCYGASMAPWLFVLSRLPVSVAYPMVSIGYVLTAALGWLFLGEVITPSRLGGIVLICAGVVLIARSL